MHVYFSFTRRICFNSVRVCLCVTDCLLHIEESTLKVEYAYCFSIQLVVKLRQFIVHFLRQRRPLSCALNAVRLRNATSLTTITYKAPSTLDKLF